MQKILFLCCCFLLAGAACGQKAKIKRNKHKFHYLSNCRTVEEIAQSKTKLEMAFYMSLGEFSNKEQSDTTSIPMLRGQEIITVPIWQKQRVGEYWAFTTWFASGNVQRPTVQFVGKYSKKDRDTIILETFAVPEAMKGIGWSQPNPYADFKPSDLIQIGCQHYLVQQPDGSWHTFLPQGGKRCPSVLAVKGKETFYELDTKTGLEVLINAVSFYDKEGNPLMSYRNMPVLCKRGDPKQPKYRELLNPKK